LIFVGRGLIGRAVRFGRKDC